MLEFVTKQRRENSLHDTVGTLGLLQYPLVFALLITWPLILFEQSGRRQLKAWSIVAFLACCGCAFLMFYRGYFSSLGW